MEPYKAPLAEGLGPPAPIRDGTPPTALIPGDSHSLDFIASEARAPETRSAGDLATARSDFSRASGTVLVEAARLLPEGPVEVTLSPEELGKVRLALLAADGQITVQVVAERIETLDLLRRHIDVLASELRQQGYSEISFSFGQGRGDGGTSTTRNGFPPDREEQHATDFSNRGAAGATQSPKTGGLDLRL
jgi:flagellar hook-length control protein FliK